MFWIRLLVVVVLLGFVSVPGGYAQKQNEEELLLKNAQRGDC